MINAQGPDVSAWDGGPTEDPQVIDFVTFPLANDFCIIKVSEGLVKDRLFDRQWGAAKGKTARMAYHFWRSFVDQKRAVQNMLGFLGNDAGEMPVALDIEAADNSTSVASLGDVWISEYHRLTGLWPIFYSYPYFMAEHGFGAKNIWGAYKHPLLRNCKLWLGQWPFDELESMPGYDVHGDLLRAVLIDEVIRGERALTWPRPLEPFQKVDFWQWTSRYPPSRIPGYYTGPNHKEAVDMNISSLSRIAFQALYPISHPPQSKVKELVVNTPDGPIVFRPG